MNSIKPETVLSVASLAGTTGVGVYSVCKIRRLEDLMAEMESQISEIASKMTTDDEADKKLTAALHKYGQVINGQSQIINQQSQHLQSLRNKVIELENQAAQQWRLVNSLYHEVEKLATPGSRDDQKEELPKTTPFEGAREVRLPPREVKQTRPMPIQATKRFERGGSLWGETKEEPRVQPNRHPTSDRPWERKLESTHERRTSLPDFDPIAAAEHFRRNRQM